MPAAIHLLLIVLRVSTVHQLDIVLLLLAHLRASTIQTAKMGTSANAIPTEQPLAEMFNYTSLPLVVLQLRVCINVGILLDVKSLFPILDHVC